MNRLGTWCGALALGWFTVACSTTGDPTQGGLFGWSETKARERQKERQAGVAHAEWELTDEQSRTQALQNREIAAAHQITAARSAREQAEQKLRAQQASLIAKTQQLERDSPTPATASRARSWRLKINTVVAQSALSPAERSSRLRVFETEIDSALAKLNH
jgi:alpha-D-ribose 1-methylphosphonate 5-triphosphate synthase subunit PhnG